MLVCTSCYGGNVSGQQQKNFSPLGSELHYSKQKYCIDHQRTWPPYQVVANQEWKIIGAMLRAQRKTNHFLIKNKTLTAVIKTVNFRIFM